MTSRARLVASLAVLFWLAPLSLRAAPAAGKTAPAALTEAADRFDLGLRLFEGGDNAAALAEFKRAYDLVPNLVVMYNIGLVYAAMGRPVEAVDALDLALADVARKLSDQQRRNAHQVRDEQASRIARVIIVTDRPATIEVDGVEVGRTPMASPLRVQSGSHTISVVASGYLPSRRQLMFAGQVTETLTLTLTPAETTTAHLAVSVSVPGAEVLVNGKAVGSTPLPASIAVPPGKAEVQVRRPGYRTVSRTVMLDEGASGSLEVALAEDPSATTPKGRLRVAVEQPDTEVAVDGVARVLGDGGTLQLPAGPHQVRVQRAGFQAAEQLIAIAADRETSFTTVLAPTLETRAALEDRARWRKLAAAGILGSGLLIAAGAAVYVVVTRNDVSGAEAQLNAQLRMEADPNENCYDGTNPPPKIVGGYLARGCGALKASLQDDLDRAKLHRGIGYGVAALGIVVAGVGTFLLATRPAASHEGAPPVSRISFWSDGSGGGVVLLGRF